MAKISTYPDVVPPALDDYIIGTDVSDSFATKSFVIADIIDLATTTGQFVTLDNCILPTYANNAAALSGGLLLNSIYKTATGEVRIVI